MLVVGDLASPRDISRGGLAAQQLTSRGNRAWRAELVRWTSILVSLHKAVLQLFNPAGLHKGAKH